MFQSNGKVDLKEAEPKSLIYMYGFYEIRTYFIGGHGKEDVLKSDHHHTFCMRKPATEGFKYLATPSVDAWALCAVPNASFT